MATGRVFRLALVVVLAAACGGRRMEGQKKMSTQQEIFDQLATLAAPEFFEPPEGRIDALESQLARTAFEGLVVNAPAAVDIAVRDTLPLLMLRKMSVLRNWEARPDLNTQIVAVDLDRGSVYVRHAYQSSKRRWPSQFDKSMSGRRPGEEEAEDTIAKAATFDARDLLRLPWQPANLLVRMIYFDWVSNAVKVELRKAGSQPAPAFFPAETARALRQQPGYEKSAGSPPLAGSGIALRVPEKVAEGAGIPIYGALRMPAYRDAVVEGGGAVLTGKLILSERDCREPIKVDLQIPAATQNPVAPGQIVEGYFHFNLREKTALNPGTYQVYFVAGEYIAGPMRLIVGAGEPVPREE